MGFVCNLILNNSCEFYYDDVTVTSFVNDKYGDAKGSSIKDVRKNLVIFNPPPLLKRTSASALYCYAAATA